MQGLVTGSDRATRVLEAAGKGCAVAALAAIVLINTADVVLRYGCSRPDPLASLDHVRRA